MRGTGTIVTPAGRFDRSISFTFRNPVVKISILTLVAGEASVICNDTGPGPVTGLGNNTTPAPEGVKVGVNVAVLTGVLVPVGEGVNVSLLVAVGVRVGIAVSVEVDVTVKANVGV